MSRKTFTCEADCPYGALRIDVRGRKPFQYEQFASQLLELYSATVDEAFSMTAIAIAGGSYRSLRGTADHKVKVRTYADALQAGIRAANPDLNTAVKGIMHYRTEMALFATAINGVCRVGPLLSKIRTGRAQEGESEYEISCGLPASQQETMLRYAHGVGATIVPSYFFSASPLERAVVNRLIELPARERRAETTIGLIETLKRAQAVFLDSELVASSAKILGRDIDDPLLIELPDQS